MSILVKSEIEERLKSGDISFDPPLDKFQLQVHSVDLRLGYTFLTSKQSEISDEGRVARQLGYGQSRDHFRTIELEEKQYFDILPNEHLIVSTLEKIKLPNDLMAILFPRSSVNRRGLSVDLSGVIDAGYEGNLVIPVRNNTRDQVIRVYPGERFCQLVFHSLSQPVKPRTSRYARKDVVVGVLAEKNTTEVRMVRAGKIKELKEKYTIKLDKGAKK